MAKYFVVRKGKKPGIYNDRETCKAQVDGFPGAKYKGFSSMQLAQEALEGGGRRTADLPIDKNYIAVDAACSYNPGPTEYQGVDLQTRKRIFHEAFPTGTNNIGEFLALVHGLHYLSEHPEHTGIYSDSKYALQRIKEGKCKTNMIRTPENEFLFARIEQAEQRLAKNILKTPSNSPKKIPIYKRETKERGQIPADFWRK